MYAIRSYYAVGSLVLDGRIPPGIHVDDIIGCSEIKAESAGLEADEKDIALAGLEGLHTFFPQL